MRDGIIVTIAAALLILGAMAQADTVVRKSGEVVRGQITESGDFLEVETYDGYFLMLRRDEVRRAVTSGGEVIAQNETGAQEKTRRRKEQAGQRMPDEHVILDSGKKIEGDVGIFGDMVEVQEPGEEFRILTKDDVQKVVNDDRVIFENPDAGPPRYEGVEIGRILFPTATGQEQRFGEGEGEGGMRGGMPYGPGGEGGPGGEEGGPGGMMMPPMGGRGEGQGGPPMGGPPPGGGFGGPPGRRQEGGPGGYRGEGPPGGMPPGLGPPGRGRGGGRGERSAGGRGFCRG